MATRKTKRPGPLVIGGRWVSVEEAYEFDMGEEASLRQTKDARTQAPAPEPLQLFDLDAIRRERAPSAAELYAENRGDEHAA